MRKLALLVTLLAIQGCGTSHGPMAGDGSVLSDGGGSTPFADGSVPSVDGSVPCADGMPGECAIESGRHEIRALAVFGDRVYWAEYGTFDALANYQHDGAVRSRPVVGGVRASDLEGLERPIDLRVTATHIYLRLESGEIVRHGRAGGTVDSLSDSGELLASNTQTCAWVDHSIVWSDFGGSPHRLFNRVGLQHLALSNTHAYIEGGGVVYRVPLTDEEDAELLRNPERLFDDPLSLARSIAFAEGAGAFTTRRGASSGTYLSLIGETGVEPTNVALISDADLRIDQLSVVGEHYAVRAYGVIAVGRIAPEGAVHNVLESGSYVDWVAVSPGVLWTNGTEIVLTAW